jgi:hypothetical protein
MPRRPLALAATLLAALLLLLPGCGGGDDKSSTKAVAGGPTGEALSYFPANAGLVALIETDGEQIQAAEALLTKFPGSDKLLDQLKAKVNATGVDFDKDVKPLLGNPIALGTAGSDLDSMVVVLVATDEAKLNALVDRQIKAGKLKKTGEQAGATIYSDGPDTALAIKDATALIADTPAQLGALLAIHNRAAGLTPATFDEPFTNGVSKDALVRISGSAPTLLANPKAASARRIPWVAALGRFAVALKAEQDAVALDARVDTSKAKLTDDDLPIAPGDASPGLGGDGPIRVALRNPAHVIDFAQRAAQAVSPTSFAAFAAAKAAIKLRFGVDLDQDVIAQLNGIAQLSTDLHEFQLRVGLKDPTAMKATLKKLAPILPDALAGAGLTGLEVKLLPDDVYALTKNGRTVANFAVIDDSLVVVNSGVKDLERFARPKGETLKGQRGALVAKVDGKLVSKALGKVLHLGDLSTVILSAIDNASGWAEISTKELRLHADVAVSG